MKYTSFVYKASGWITYLLVLADQHLHGGLLSLATLCLPED
jgi:hypothetical protein